LKGIHDAPFPIMKFLIIALGGAAGSLMRYGTTRLFPDAEWPLATLLVNVAGSFLIGLLAGLMIRLQWPQEVWLAVAVGLCGGFTTLSAFSLENLNMLEQGQWPKALLYITATVVLSVIACWLGKKLAA